MDVSCQCSAVNVTLPQHENIYYRSSSPENSSDEEEYGVIPRPYEPYASLSTNTLHAIRSTKRELNCDPMSGDSDRKGKTLLKQLKPDLEINLKQKDSDPENELSPIQYSEWVNLPYVALVEIYKCLSIQDRFSVSLTCKAWSQAFSHPELWRHARFRFDGIEDWRAPLFVGPLALWVRHLEIDCQRTSDKISRSSRGSMTCLYDFLDGMIKCGNFNLVTIKLVNMVRLSRWFQWYKNRDLLQVLLEFLSMQTNLKMLDLSRAGLGLNQGNYLLSKIAMTIGANVSTLNLNDLYYPKQDSTQIAECLQAFTNLTELSIDYENLSDDLLDALAVPCSLKCINVCVLVKLNFLPVISESWEKLKNSCPSLEANYYIRENLGHFDTLMSILTPGIPLVSLKFSLVAPCSDWFDICTYIADNFKNHLRRLSIEICEYTIKKDPTINAINTIIQSCLFLEELTVTDPVDLIPDQCLIKRSIKEAIARQPYSRLHRFTFQICAEVFNKNVHKHLVEQLDPVVHEKNRIHFRSLSR